MISRDIQKVKDKLININLTGVMILMIPALVSSYMRYSITGLIPLMIIQLIGALIFTALFIFRHKIPWNIKAHTMLITAILVGLSATFSFGLSAGIVYISGGPILAALFFSKKKGTIYLLVSTLFFFFIGWLYVNHLVIPVSGEVAYYRTYSSWLAVGIGIILVSYAVILSVGKFNLLFYRAISDLKESSDQLETSYSALLEVLEFLPVPVGISNELGEITFINQSFRATFGYSLEDIDTVEKWYFKAYPDPILRQRYVERWEKIVGNEKNQNVLNAVGTYQVRCKNGEDKQILLYSKKLVNRLLVTFIDITQQYTTEELLRTQKEQLIAKNQEYQLLNEELNKSNEKIQRINEELIVAKNEAERSDKLKSVFLANMSHEIRTPMNGIVGFAGLLREPGLPEEEQQSYLEIIMESCDRLLNIVNDVLDISKIETGQIEIHHAPANLNHQLQSLQLLYTNLAIQKGIEFNFIQALPDEKVWISTDATKLYQILNNLLNNAFKFTQKGKVTLGYEKTDSGFAFFVKDTGIGINKNQQELIFQRFFQAIDHKSAEHGGAGLGLSIAKAFVDVMGGIIGLESEPGKGTTFTVELPMINLSSENYENIESLPLLKFDPQKTLLVVEDEDLYYQYLSSVLKESGIKLHHARNGRAAIDYINGNSKIHLILMDIRLPDISGFETTIQIKKSNPDIPVIAVSGYPLSDIREKIESTGFSDFIRKPVTPGKLMEIIKTHMA